MSFKLLKSRESARKAILAAGHNQSAPFGIVVEKIPHTRCYRVDGHPGQYSLYDAVLRAEYLASPAGNNERRNPVRPAIELRTYGGLESGTISGRDMTDIANDVDWRGNAIDRIHSGDVGQSPYDIGLALALAGF